MNAQSQLEDDILRAFQRACHERDWEIAEYLFQALEAIANRDGHELRLDAALDVLVQEWADQRH